MYKIKITPWGQSWDWSRSSLLHDAVNGKLCIRQVLGIVKRETLIFDSDHIFELSCPSQTCMRRKCILHSLSICTPGSYEVADRLDCMTFVAGSTRRGDCCILKSTFCKMILHGHKVSDWCLERHSKSQTGHLTRFPGDACEVQLVLEQYPLCMINPITLTLNSNPSNFLNEMTMSIGST